MQTKELILEIIKENQPISIYGIAVKLTQQTKSDIIKNPNIGKDIFSWRRSLVYYHLAGNSSRNQKNTLVAQGLVKKNKEGLWVLA